MDTCDLSIWLSTSPEGIRHKPNSQRHPEDTINGFSGAHKGGEPMSIRAKRRYSTK